MDATSEVEHLCMSSIRVGLPVCACRGTGQTCCLKDELKDKASQATFLVGAMTLE